MPVLFEIEPIGERVVTFFLNETAEPLYHPFAALSQEFCTPFLLKQFAHKLGQYYSRRIGNIPAVDWHKPQERMHAIQHSGRVRIGYVSSHFRLQHPIGSLTEFVFAHHDRAKFEVFCYAIHRPVNASLESPFRLHCEHFRACYVSPSNAHLPADPILECQGDTPLSLFQQIRQDIIHVLVDLDGYMDLIPKRLIALAALPAPVLVNWLGYAIICFCVCGFTPTHNTHTHTHKHTHTHTHTHTLTRFNSTQYFFLIFEYPIR